MLRLRCWTPAASIMATWERLRCTSIPTYTPMSASFPELDWSRSLGCPAEQGTGARPTERQVNPSIVGLAGLEPAASSLSAIEDQQSRAHRCADRPFPTSLATVDESGIGHGK